MIIDSADILSSYAKEYLNQQDLTNIGSKTITQLMVTDPSEKFNQFASNILNDNFCNISTIQPF